MERSKLSLTNYLFWMDTIEFILMQKENKKVTTEDEKAAWHFVGQVCKVADAAGSYLAGELTEKKLMSVLLATLLKMNVICQQTIDRLAKHKRTEIEKESQRRIRRLVREKIG